MTRRSGFSLVELIITMCLIMIMVGGAVVYYSDIIQQSKRDKAHSDLRQLMKVVSQYESSQASPLTTYAEISEDPLSQDLRGLVALRLMPAVPADPWDGEYRIDLAMGILSSSGPDNVFDHVSPTSPINDDIVVHYKAEFEGSRATLDSTGRTLEVDFTRSVAYDSLTTDLTFSITPAPPSPITTTIVDIVYRHRVRVKFADPLPAGSYEVTVHADAIQAADGGLMAKDSFLAFQR